MSISIPSKQDYEKFIEVFSNSLSSSAYRSNISFFIYGSYLREDFIPGASDLDGFLILEDNFYTDKDEICFLSCDLKASLRASNKNIRTQFNVLDEGIAHDGRFLAYSRDYVNFFKSKAVRIHGNYDLENMTGFDYKNQELTSISHNLSSVRNGFLYQKINYEEKPDFYKRDLLFPLKKLNQLPKQIINLATGALIENKEQALKEFVKMFPNYNPDFAINMNKIIQDPVRYNSFLEEDGYFVLSIGCLGDMELMLKAYQEKFPLPCQREVRDIEE